MRVLIRETASDFGVGCAVLRVRVCEGVRA
jgi:hypothetical protein